MPMRKYKKKTYTRSSFKKRNPSYKRKLVKTIKAVVNRAAETKFLDTATTANINSAGTIYAYHTLINQGATNYDRVGSRLFLKGLFMRMRFTGDLNALSIGQTVRVVLVRGKAENGTALVAGNILQTLNTALTTLSHRAFQSSAKYTILYDKVFTLSSGGEAGADGKSATKLITTYIKNNHDVTYSGNGNAAYDGGIYLLLVGDEAADATNPQVDMVIRQYWTDS